MAAGQLPTLDHQAARPRPATAAGIPCCPARVRACVNPALLPPSLAVFFAPLRACVPCLAALVSPCSNLPREENPCTASPRPAHPIPPPAALLPLCRTDSASHVLILACAALPPREPAQLCVPRLCVVPAHCNGFCSAMLSWQASAQRHVPESEKRSVRLRSEQGAGKRKQTNLTGVRLVCNPANKALSPSGWRQWARGCWLLAPAAGSLTRRMQRPPA